MTASHESTDPQNAPRSAAAATPSGGTRSTGTPAAADLDRSAADPARGLETVPGFEYAGVAAGLKSTGAEDVALVRNLGPRCDAAAVFTSNRFAAAPVQVSREAVADGRIRAVVLNSGGANACTGARGLRDARDTAEHVAALLDGDATGTQTAATRPEEVLVCSTGLIGEHLPMDRLRAGAAAAARGLGTGPEAAESAARAIMTTDTVPKRAAVECPTPQGPVHLAGIAKGAGMLAPGLATMLVVLTTDAVLDPAALDAALREAVEYSFNRADSDGCMSTNDTVALMASGASGIAPDQQAFTQALTAVCRSLAEQLISDAEGASHDITVRTTHAATEAEALEVSRAVARSNLFKCAVFGNDPNWGRILSEVGTTSARFDPGEVDVVINGVAVCRGGGVGEDRSLVDLAGSRAVDVTIDLAAGEHEASILTNDLTHDYVEENSAYSS